MSQRVFITGTDTHVGKTHISCGLLQQLAMQGYSTLGLKPLSSGCEITAEGLRNEDALQLQAAANIKCSYEQINPMAFEPAIAPHIAAEQQGMQLTISDLIQQCQPGLNQDVDYTIIEGVGGWLMPLNNTETMADFAVQVSDAVILVVGIQLGCLNHTLLTWQAMQQTSLPCLGWVANCLQPDTECVDENIVMLKQRLPIPCLGLVDYGQSEFTLSL